MYCAYGPSSGALRGPRAELTKQKRRGTDGGQSRVRLVQARTQQSKKEERKEANEANCARHGQTK